MVKVEGIGNVPIPVSVEVCTMKQFVNYNYSEKSYAMCSFASKDVEKIKKVCSPAQFGVGLNQSVDSAPVNAWKLDASKINFDGMPENLAELISKNLVGWDVDRADVKMKLDNLVLY